MPVDTDPTLLTRITLVLALAAVLDGLCHRCSAAVRHAIWRGAILVAVIMPMVQAALPAWRVLPDATSRVVLEGVPALRAPEAPDALGLVAWLSLLWVAGSAFFALRLAIGLQQRHRLVRATVDAPAFLRRAAHGAAKRLGVSRRIRVRLACAHVTPCTFGTWRPTVIVPAGGAQWPPDRLANVLHHELAHVRRHDNAVVLVTRLLHAALWWHPLVLLACRRVDALAEQACDDLALGAGARPGTYAEDLLAIAIGRPLPAVAGFRGRHALSTRIERVLDAGCPRSLVGARAPRACTALALALAVPLGCLQPRGAAPSVTAVVHPARPTVAMTEGARGVTTAPEATAAPSTPAVRVARPRSPASSAALLRAVQAPALQFAYAERVDLLIRALRTWHDTPHHRDILREQLSALPSSSDRAAVITMALQLPAGSATARAMLPEIRGIPGARLRGALLARAAQRGDLSDHETTPDWLAAQSLSRAAAADPR